MIWALSTHRGWQVQLMAVQNLGQATHRVQIPSQLQPFCEILSDNVFPYAHLPSRPQRARGSRRHCTKQFSYSLSKTLAGYWGCLSGLGALLKFSKWFIFLPFLPSFAFSASTDIWLATRPLKLAQCFCLHLCFDYPNLWTHLIYIYQKLTSLA